MPTKTATRLTMKPRHRKLAERLVKSGRFASANEVVDAAMSLLEEEECDYAECVEAIRLGLAEADAGLGRPWEEFCADFERKFGLRRRRGRSTA